MNQIQYTNKRKPFVNDSAPNLCPTCGKVIPSVRRDNLEPIIAAQYCGCPSTASDEATTPVQTKTEEKSA